MNKEVFRFYSTKTLLIASLNVTRKKGTIEIVPAINPNRKASPVMSGEKVYNYDKKFIFSLMPSEALNLFSDIMALEIDPNYKTKSIIHDRSKTQNSNENILTMMSVNLWKNNLVLNITYKSKGQNDDSNRIGYLFYNNAEKEQFKHYLRFIGTTMSPMVALLESWYDGMKKQNNKNKNNYNNSNYNNYNINYSK